MKLVNPLLLTLLLLVPCLAGDMASKQKDIPPKKGDISKNIHVIFDKSGSMSMDKLAKAYKEIEMITMQNTDEFNLAVTAFGGNHCRLKFKDKECSVGDNWLAMPSADHYKRIMGWLTFVPIDTGGSQIVTALKEILKENKKNVTIIVITDCDITSVAETFKLITDARKDKKHHEFKLGFVNVDSRTTEGFYKEVKKNKCWYVSTPPPAPLLKEEIPLDLDDDDFWK